MSAAQFVRRAVLVGASALLAAAALVLFFAWVALAAEWEVPDPRELTGPSTITASDGTVLARFDSEVDRRVVSIDAVSDEAIAAIVASEDARFFEHEGVDTVALLRAVVTNLRTGAIQQGGSTLTQQYVKNAFTGAERTIIRKVREAVISIQLERERTKEEILEEYLNTVYFGEGAYGVEAAALTYFGLSAAELDLAQAATLAQLLPAPSVRNPRVDPQGAMGRRDALLDRMAALGVVDEDAASAAQRAPLEVREREPRRFDQPYFVAHVRQVIERAYGPEALVTGALEVRTTLDPDAQRRLDAAVTDHLPDPETGYEIAAAVVEPETGDVLAMHAGRDRYGDTSAYSRTDYAQVNLATQGARQAGSTFKPFVLIAALEDGLTPATTYAAPAQARIGDWTPRNADGRGYGSLTLTEAMVRSVNTVYAHLGADVGAGAIADVAARMGVRNPIEDDVTIALGAGERGPSVLDMASAYATLANDGLACPARTILAVRDRDGRALEPPAERAPDADLLESRPDRLVDLDEGRCYQAIDRDVAREVNRILEQAVERGTGARARIDRPQAGKTGTTNDLTDAWFVGYTPDLSLAVWAGDPDERRPITDVGGFGQVFGGTLPALVWRDAAAELLTEVAPRAFPEPGDLRAGARRPGPAMSRDDPHPSPDPSPDPTPDPPPADDGPPPEDDEPDDEDDGDDGDDGGVCIPPIIRSGC